MVTEYRGSLLVVNGPGRNDHIYSVEVFRKMDVFKYLSILPTDRYKWRLVKLEGKTEGEAVQKAKDFLNGQLGLGF